MKLKALLLLILSILVVSLDSSGAPLAYAQNCPPLPSISPITTELARIKAVIDATAAEKTAGNKYIINETEAGKIQTTEKTAFLAVYTSLNNNAASLRTFGSNKCGEDAFNAYETELRAAATSYEKLRNKPIVNYFRVETGRTSTTTYRTLPLEGSELTLQALSYGQGQTECANILGTTSSLGGGTIRAKLDLSQLKITEAEKLLDNGTPILSAGSTEVERLTDEATRAWQDSLTELEKAKIAGCDKGTYAATYQARRDEAFKQMERLNAVRTAYGKVAQSFTAVAGQTLKNAFESCESCENKFGDYVIVKDMLEGLCCLLFGFVKTMKDISNDIAHSLQLAIDKL